MRDLLRKVISEIRLVDATVGRERLANSFENVFFDIRMRGGCYSRIAAREIATS